MSRPYAGEYRSTSLAASFDTFALCAVLLFVAAILLGAF